MINKFMGKLLLHCLLLLGFGGLANAGSYSRLKERSEKDTLGEKYFEQINSQQEMTEMYSDSTQLHAIREKLAQWKRDWEKLLQKEPEGIDLFKLQEPSFKEKRLLVSSEKALDILKKEVDMETVLAAALERNPTIAAAKKKWRGTLEKFTQADRLEHLMGQYESFVRDVKPGVSAMSGGESKEFPFPGLTALKGDMALKEVEIAREQYLLTVRDTLTQTEEAYYQRVFLFKSIEIIQEDLKLLKDLESSAIAQYNTGKTGYSNVIKVNTMLEKSETDLKNEMENRQTVTARINYLLHLPENFTLGTFQEPEIRPRTVSIDAVYHQALKSRQEIIITQKTIETINLAIQMAEKKIYPDYTLGYSSYEQVVHAKPEMKEKPAQMPKYWFGTNDAYTREARMNYQALQKKLESEERELLYRLKDESRTLNTSLRDLKLYRDSLLKLAQDDLEVSLKDYQGGRVGFLDVLEAEKQLLKYRLAFQMAIRDHHQSQARIRQLVGKDF